MRRLACALVLTVLLTPAEHVGAQERGVIAGIIIDPLGSRVAGATVTLLRDGHTADETTATQQGEFAFDGVPEGRYSVAARADGFATTTTDPFFTAASRRTVVEVSLAIGGLRQDVVVTAAATAVPTAQIGAQVTVLDSQTLATLEKPELLEALRLVPGAQVVQAGARGSLTSFFVRGGASSFSKVLIDGVPANDIGGGFDFSSLSTAGVDRVEVLREANSVLYGTDSLTGVVSITTPRGRATPPAFSYSIDGGSFQTFRNAVSIAGAVERVDYFSEFADLRTDNEVPNNEYRNSTYAGRFGVALDSTDLSGTIRRTDTRNGSPNAIGFYEISDDTFHENDFTYIGVTARSQIADRLQSTVRVAFMEQNLLTVNPSPTGEPFDPFGFGAHYLGNSVSIRGANGYSVTGRAILDFGGTYPSPFESHTTRRLVNGQATYHVASGLDLSGGVRYEHEDGFTLFNETSRSESVRNNGGVFAEVRAAVRRLHVTGGIGFDHNAVYKSAVSPRLSIAAYVRDSSSTSALGETKVIFNIGRGIKAPAIYQELSSLFAVLPPEQAGTLGIHPIGPERARNLDAGVEQGLWKGQLRVRATVFHNNFSDLIEFVSAGVLPQLGFSPEAAAATGFGAYVNSQSYRARGLETSVEAAVGPQVRVAASYTFLDAEVVESFSSSALAPSINPAFPDIEIGAFSPLVGARPFRRPTHSGSLLLSYTQGRGQIALVAYLSGKQDDSTFLSDAFFGNSMLLPNKDLDPAYQKFDISGSYRIHPRLRWYASVENIGGERYEAVAGFPSLPRTFRSGVSVLLGNHSATP